MLKHLKHLNKSQKNMLSHILGTAVLEITEDINNESNIDDEKREKFNKLQENMLDIINTIETNHNLNKNQYLLSSQVVLNGIKNLNNVEEVYLNLLKTSDDEDEKELSRDILKLTVEELYTYTELLKSLKGIITQL